ncbi:MAG: hypothetical protein KAV87_19700 [Desulfobacteraceae bacterium]|nr:hypothetical protein [Desulfobacteraceae bacterium]
MSDCELLPNCPFFNGYFQEISEPNTNFKEEYCHGNYVWCGRYILFKRIEADKKLIEKSMVAVSGINDNHEVQRLAHAVKPAI